MKTVVDLEAAFAGLEHLRKEIAVRPAAVQVVLAGTEVVQARGHAALRGCTAFAYRVFLQRRVDPGVHVRIDHTGKRQPATAVVDRLCFAEVFSNSGELFAGDRDVGVFDRIRTGSNDADVAN